MTGGIVNNQGLAQPTRFPGGTTNVIKQATFGYYPYFDELKSHRLQTDFDSYASTNYTITKTGTGTNALVAGDGGLLAITNSAASGDLQELQTPVATFSYTPGQRLVFKSLLAIDDATNAEFFIGLQNTNTDATAPTNGTYFHKASGSTNIDFVTVSASTTTTIAAVATMVAAVNTSFGFLYDGKGEIKIYINEVQVNDQPTIAAPLGYTLSNPVSALPVGNLALTVMVKNGTAAARTLTWDGYEVLKERFV